MIDKEALRAARLKQLSDDDLLRIDMVEAAADLGTLALEGLEVHNCTEYPVRVRLYLSQASGRFYLDIYNPGADGTRIEAENQEPNWVPVEVKKIA